MSIFQNVFMGVSVMAQWLMNTTRNHEILGLVPGLLSGLRIWHCCELWYRLQMQLRPNIAVAVVQAGSCSSDLTPAWEIPYATGAALTKEKKKITV